MSGPLLDPDPRIRAGAWERLVLEACGVSEETLPFQACAHAYRALSEGYTGRSDPSEPVFALPDILVRALVFGGRTFEVASRLLHAYPPREGPLVELGSGCAPFGLAAAIRARSRPCEISLFDRSAHLLKLAADVFALAGVGPPALHHSNVAAFQHRCSAVFAPFLLNELMGQGLDAVRVTRRWLSLIEPGGLLYIVEPGQHEAARRLQSLRDELCAEFAIVGPCVSALPCPMLASTRDWCHFTWFHHPGPATRRIADLARRRYQELHFSWLILENAPPRSTPGARVLEVESLRRLARASVCTGAQVVRLEALRRDPAVEAAWEQLRSGCVLDLADMGEPQKLKPMRVATPTQLRVLRDL